VFGAGLDGYRRPARRTRRGRAVQSMRLAYFYFIQLIDESGANSRPGNIFHSVALNYTNIVDMRPE
jgi:hypothetical protein